MTNDPGCLQSMKFIREKRKYVKQVEEQTFIYTFREILFKNALSDILKKNCFDHRRIVLVSNNIYLTLI